MADRAQDIASPQSSPARTQGLLEEYRALRAEIVAHMQMQRQSQSTFVLLAAGLLGYAFTNMNPFVCLLAWAITLYYWRSYRTENHSIVRLSRYIVQFLEEPGGVPGLAWEKRIGRADEVAQEQGWPYRTACRRVLHQLLSPHALLSLASVLGTIVLGMKQFLLRTPDYVMAVACLLVVIAHSGIAVILSPRLSTFVPLRDWWTAVFRKVAAMETCDATPEGKGHFPPS